MTKASELAARLAPGEAGGLLALPQAPSAAAVASLKATGVRVAWLDGPTSRDALFDELDRGLRFPSYFGRNWDAVDECLRDLSWLPAEGYVLVVVGAERLWRRDPRMPARLVRSWLFCAEHWARRERPFHLVFEW